MDQQKPTLNPFLSSFLYLLSLAIGASLAYHGYKRNESVGWAAFWGIIGGAFWPIALPVAVAQGFGERAKGLQSGSYH